MGPSGTFVEPQSHNTGMFGCRCKWLSFERKIRLPRKPPKTPGNCDTHTPAPAPAGACSTKTPLYVAWPAHPKPRSPGRNGRRRCRGRIRGKINARIFVSDGVHWHSHPSDAAILGIRCIGSGAKSGNLRANVLFQSATGPISSIKEREVPGASYPSSGPFILLVERLSHACS